MSDIEEEPWNLISQLKPLLLLIKNQFKKVQVLMLFQVIVDFMPFSNTIDDKFSSMTVCQTQSDLSDMH